MEALYRRWRPQRFEEVVGQEGVVRTLRNALLLDRVAHAYLFAGPRGTGKTSTARILAKGVNCLDPDPARRPCDACEPCREIAEGRALDLIEIDAASNRGIDEIRQLRERILLAPARFRRKVYIIDEVHMLTPEAFNALLKTLEEPPAHALFILATTEPHRVPPTILSRCQRLDFRRIPPAQIAERLLEVARAEGIELTEEGAQLLARLAHGGVRDALSLLDQLAAYGDGRVDVRRIRQVLGLAEAAWVEDVLKALARREAGEVLAALEAAFQQGLAPRLLARQILEGLRLVLYARAGTEALRALGADPEEAGRLGQALEGVEARELVRWLRLFAEAEAALKGSEGDLIPLELAALEAMEPPARPRVRRVEARKAAASTPSGGGEGAQRPKGSPEGDLKGRWQEVIRRVRRFSPTLQALLRSGIPLGLEGDRLTVGFPYDFHRQKVSERENLRILEQVAARVFGLPELKVECVRTGGARKPQTNPEVRSSVRQDPLVRAAQNLFDARVVEILPPEEEPGEEG